jgi:hypothetical protein
MRNEGRVTKDTFAVVMHLINGVLEGKDLPVTLPPTLVPPSMRLPASPFPNAAFDDDEPTFALQQNTQYASLPSGMTEVGVSRTFTPQYTGGSERSHQPDSTVGSQRCLHPHSRGQMDNSDSSNIHQVNAQGGPPLLRLFYGERRAVSASPEEFEVQVSSYLDRRQCGAAHTYTSVLSTGT